MNKLTPQFLRLREVSEITSLGHSAIYARIARGDFPAPQKISIRCSVWDAEGVYAWMRSRPVAVGPRPGAAPSLLLPPGNPGQEA